MARVNQKQVVFRIGEHVVTALVTLFAGYLTLQGTQGTNNAALVETLYAQVRDLEKQVFQQNAMIVSLRIELSKKYESSAVIRDYLDAMPYPAWIKIVTTGADGKPEFRMLWVNTKYSIRYDVSQKRYAGRTDFEVWDEGVASTFYDNDIKVFHSLDYRCVTEEFPQNALEPVSVVNPMVSGFVCKWPLEINGQTAIAGMMLQKRDVKTR